MSKNINSNQQLSGDEYSDIRDNIQRLILDMYLPAANEAETDEYVSNTDLLDTMRGVMEMEGEYLFSVMKELEFKTKLIEGTVYWMVKVS